MDNPNKTEAELFDEHYEKIGSDLVISRDNINNITGNDINVIAYDIDTSKLNIEVVNYMKIYSSICQIKNWPTELVRLQRKLLMNYYKIIIYELFDDRHSILKLNTSNWKKQKDIIDNLEFNNCSCAFLILLGVNIKYINYILKKQERGIKQEDELEQENENEKYKKVKYIVKTVSLGNFHNILYQMTIFAKTKNRYENISEFSSVIDNISTDNRNPGHCLPNTLEFNNIMHNLECFYSIHSASKYDKVYSGIILSLIRLIIQYMLPFSLAISSKKDFEDNLKIYHEGRLANTLENWKIFMNTTVNYLPEKINEFFGYDNICDLITRQFDIVFDCVLPSQKTMISMDVLTYLYDNNYLCKDYHIFYKEKIIIV